MIKISVTNIKLYYRNYLILATLKYEFLKKELVRLESFLDYFFSNLIVLLDKSTFQRTVSPFCNSRMSRIVFGIEVDNVPPVDCSLVVYFNSIPPYILLIVFILLYW